MRRALRPGCHSIAVISPKGGVGKTTLTYMLGSVLARVRRERVLVVDTNPDFGTLADLAPAIVPATLSDLLRDLDTIGSYGELSSYTTTTETGMHILAAPQDPIEMVRLGRDGYQAVSDVLHRHYDVVIYDCGTGFLDDITQFALGRVDQVVLVTTPSLVTTKIIVGAVDHLGATGFDPTRTTLAVNMVRRGDLLDRARLRTAMTSRIGGSVEVPFDEKVQRAMDTGEFRYASLANTTRLAMKRLAAEVVGRMPGPEPEAPPPAPEPAEATVATAPVGAEPERDAQPRTPAQEAEASTEPAPASAEPPFRLEPAEEAERPDADGRRPGAPAVAQPGRRLAFDWDPHDPDA
jgi:MinD-like ATPase involved in chromosome partitioning or flagellar assembly